MGEGKLDWGKFGTDHGSDIGPSSAPHSQEVCFGPSPHIVRFVRVLAVMSISVPSRGGGKGVLHPPELDEAAQFEGSHSMPAPTGRDLCVRPTILGATTHQP